MELAQDFEGCHGFGFFLLLGGYLFSIQAPRPRMVNMGKRIRAKSIRFSLGDGFRIFAEPRLYLFNCPPLSVVVVIH